jgi:hypothetical protein
MRRLAMLGSAVLVKMCEQVYISFMSLGESLFPEAMGGSSAGC